MMIVFFLQPAGDDHHDFDDIGGDHMMDHMDNGTQDDIPESQQIPYSQNTMVEEISHRFEGAPEIVGFFHFFFSNSNINNFT